MSDDSKSVSSPDSRSTPDQSSAKDSAKKTRFRFVPMRVVNTGLPGRSVHTSKKLRRAELKDECLRLRRMGYSYREIGERVGINDTYASTLVKEEVKSIEKRTRESADMIRAIEVERLDAMLVGLWPAATNGDVRSVDAALKLSERRAKLLGLEVPVEKEPESTLLNAFASRIERAYAHVQVEIGAPTPPPSIESE